MPMFLPLPLAVSIMLVDCFSFIECKGLPFGLLCLFSVNDNARRGMVFFFVYNSIIIADVSSVNCGRMYQMLTVVLVRARPRHCFHRFFTI